MSDRLAGRALPDSADGLPLAERGVVLVVDEKVPEHDVHAGALTTFHYLSIMRREGLRVIFRPDDGRRRQPYADELSALGVELLTGDLDVADWLARHGSELDQVLLARPNVARRYLRHVRRRSAARVLYLDHDLHFLREQRRYEVTHDAAALSESRRLFEIETDLFRDVDVVLTFSADEVPRIKELAPGAHVRVVTPAFYGIGRARRESDPEAPPMEERRGILFVGAYDHLPNVDAARFLATEIMPLVWDRHPEAELTLIGAHVTPEVERLASDHIRVTGHVPSLQPYWQGARMSVAPLRFGSGVKGKIIASLEAGVPVVTTPVGNEGIGLQDGREALIGQSPRDLADHAISLLDDPHRAAGLAEAGRHVLRERFGESRVHADLMAALGLEPGGQERLNDV